METDASEKAYGGHIFQLKNGAELSLGYHSKTYTEAQKKYSAGEKELLAIVSCTEHFHYFLFGRHFQVFSDHMPLTFLLTKTNPSKRLQRWLERLSSYSFTILYKPGKENLVADALSRVYDDEELVPVAPSDEDYDSIVAAIDTTPPHHTFSLIAAINPMVERDTHEELRRQQADDPDIMWTINLISTHGDYRPEDIVPNSPI